MIKKFEEGKPNEDCKIFERKQSHVVENWNDGSGSGDNGKCAGGVPVHNKFSLLLYPADKFSVSFRMYICSKERRPIF